MPALKRVLVFLNPGLLRVLSWLAGSAIVSVVALYIISVRPPGKLVSIKDNGAVVVAGGHFVLIVHTDKRRYCPERKQRWLFHRVSLSGQSFDAWLYIGNIPQPPVPIGQDFYGVELPLPAQADPDDYSYMSYTDYDCGLLHGLFSPPPSESPVIPLRVVAPTGTKVLPIVPLAPIRLDGK